MPIKPENRARYPANWSEIRAQILQRAGHRCEHEGCNAVHRSEGYWHDGRFVPMPAALRDAGFSVGDMVACDDGTTLKLIRIILTIAHLDHTPQNCDPSNLRAWCQHHHLAYDREHHATNAYMTRRARLRNLELEL